MFSPIHLVSRERLESPKPYSFLQPHQLILWSVVPLALYKSSFITYILNISEGRLWHTYLDISYPKSLKIKSHLGNVLPWYFNYISLRKVLKFSWHLCAVSRKLSHAKESSNKDLLLYRRNIVLAYSSLTAMASDWLRTIEDAGSEMHCHLFLHGLALHSAVFFGPDVANLCSHHSHP